MKNILHPLYLIFIICYSKYFCFKLTSGLPERPPVQLKTKHLVSRFISVVTPNNLWTLTRFPARRPRSSDIRTTRTPRSTTTSPRCGCPRRSTSQTTSDRCVWQQTAASSISGRPSGSPDGGMSNQAVRTELSHEQSHPYFQHLSVTC